METFRNILSYFYGLHIGTRKIILVIYFYFFAACNLESPLRLVAFIAQLFR